MYLEYDGPKHTRADQEGSEASISRPELSWPMHRERTENKERYSPSLVSRCPQMSADVVIVTT